MDETGAFSVRSALQLATKGVAKASHNTRRRRRRMACEACHSLKVKCSQELPSCGYCRARGLACWYRDTPLSPEAVLDQRQGSTDSNLTHGGSTGGSEGGSGGTDGGPLSPKDCGVLSLQMAEVQRAEVMTITANSRWQARVPFEHAVDRSVAIGDSYLSAVVPKEVLYGLYDIWREWVHTDPRQGIRYQTATPTDRQALYNSFCALTSFTYGCGFSLSNDLHSRTHHFATLALRTGEYILRCLQEHPEELEDSIAVAVMFLWRSVAGVVPMMGEDSVVLSDLLALIQDKCGRANPESRQFESQAGVETITAVVLQNRSYKDLFSRSCVLRQIDLAVPRSEMTFGRALSTCVSIPGCVLYGLASVGLLDFSVGMVDVTLENDIPPDLLQYLSGVAADTSAVIEMGSELILFMPRLERMVDVVRMHAGYIMWRLNPADPFRQSVLYCQRGLAGWLERSGEPGHCFNSTCVDSILLALQALSYLDPSSFLLLLDRYTLLDPHHTVELSTRGRLARSQVDWLRNKALSRLAEKTTCIEP